MAGGIIIPWLSQSTPSGHYSRAATDLWQTEAELHYMGRKEELNVAKRRGERGGRTGPGSEETEMLAGDGTVLM